MAPVPRRAGVAVLVVAAFLLAGAVVVTHGRLPPAAGPQTVARPGPLAVADADPDRVRPAIGPGTVTETPGAGICTAGFVFAAGGRLFLGQAAHCAGTGPDTETDGCTSSTLPLGSPVTVRGADGPVTGTLRYSSWVAMQTGPEPDPDTCAYNDFALVELPPEAAARTGPAVPMLGGPTGVADTGPAPGSTVRGLADPAGPDGRRALAVRDGVPEPDEGGGWLHVVRTPVPGAPGESGAPLLDDRGRALGVLTGARVGVADRVEYADLNRSLSYARTHGAPPDLALVPG